MSDERNIYGENDNPAENKSGNINTESTQMYNDENASHFSSRPDEYAGAGVGERTEVGSQSAHTAEPMSFAGTGAHSEHTEQPKMKKEKKARIGGGALAAIIALCVVLSSGAGFGGAYLYGKLFPSSHSGSSTVNVIKTDSPAAAEPEEGSLAETVSKVSDTVVEIKTETVSYNNLFGNYVTGGAGSGVIISEDGYIITNNHVISGASTITVTLKDGTEYKAELIATDSKTDVAVIKVDATGLHPATIGSSENLVVGERTIAIGNPLGELGGTVTFGFVSSLDREVTIDGTKMNLLQTDTAINPGNSGGGLFNAKGELIGIVNAKSSGSDIEGIGFAIPIDTAFSVAENLIEKGYVEGRPALGVSVVKIENSNDYYKYYGTEIYKYIDTFGVYVTEDTRGNFEFGDRIVAIDGTSVSDYESLSEQLSSHKVGDTVKVTVSRNRKMAEVEVTLIEMNANAGTASGSQDK